MVVSVLASTRQSLERNRWKRFQGPFAVVILASR